MSYPKLFSQERNLLSRFMIDNEKNLKFFSLSIIKQHSLSSFDEEKI